MKRYTAVLLFSAAFAWGQPLNLTYTAAQADLGKVAYDRACSSCHGPALDDGEFAPPLKGAAFLNKWTGKGADQVFTYMSTRMPPDRPNGLGKEVYAQVLAYVLSNNRIAAGAREVPSDVAALQEMRIPNGPMGVAWVLSRGVALPPVQKKANPLDKFTPVTEAMLASPPVADWLNWRRTFRQSGIQPVEANHEK